MEAPDLPAAVKVRVYSEPSPASKRPQKLQGPELLNKHLNRLSPTDRARVLAKLNPTPPPPQEAEEKTPPYAALLGLLVGAGLAYAAWRLTRAVDVSAVKETAASLLPDTFENLQ